MRFALTRRVSRPKIGVERLGRCYGAVALVSNCCAAFAATGRLRCRGSKMESAASAAIRSPLGGSRSIRAWTNRRPSRPAYRAIRQPGLSKLNSQPPHVPKHRRPDSTNRFLWKLKGEMKQGSSPIFPAVPTGFGVAPRVGENPLFSTCAEINRRHERHFLPSLKIVNKNLHG